MGLSKSYSIHQQLAHLQSEAESGGAPSIIINEGSLPDCIESVGCQGVVDVDILVMDFSFLEKRVPTQDAVGLISRCNPEQLSQASVILLSDSPAYICESKYIYYLLYGAHLLKKQLRSQTGECIASVSKAVHQVWDTIVAHTGHNPSDLTHLYTRLTPGGPHACEADHNQLRTLEITLERRRQLGLNTSTVVLAGGDHDLLCISLLMAALHPELRIVFVISHRVGSDSSSYITCIDSTALLQRLSGGTSSLTDIAVTNALHMSLQGNDYFRCPFWSSRMHTLVTEAPAGLFGPITPLESRGFWSQVSSHIRFPPLFKLLGEEPAPTRNQLVALAVKYGGLPPLPASSTDKRCAYALLRILQATCWLFAVVSDFDRLLGVASQHPFNLGLGHHQPKSGEFSLTLADSWENGLSHDLLNNESACEILSEMIRCPVELIRESAVSPDSMIRLSAFLYEPFLHTLPSARADSQANATDCVALCRATHIAMTDPETYQRLFTVPYAALLSTWSLERLLQALPIVAKKAPVTVGMERQRVASLSIASLCLQRNSSYDGSDYTSIIMPPETVFALINELQDGSELTVISGRCIPQKLLSIVSSFPQAVGFQVLDGEVALVNEDQQTLHSIPIPFVDVLELSSDGFWLALFK